MVRTYGHLCFRGVEDLSLELGGSLERVCFWAHVFPGTCGAFLRTQEKRPCGLNFVAGVKGPPAGLDVKVRNLGLAWLGGSSPKLPAPEVPLDEGQHCSLDKTWSATATDRSGGEVERNLGHQLDSTTLHWSEAKPKPLRHYTWGGRGGVRMPATAASDSLTGCRRLPMRPVAILSTRKFFLV